MSPLHAQEWPEGFTMAPPTVPGWYWRTEQYDCGTCWREPEPTQVVADGTVFKADFVSDLIPLILHRDKYRRGGSPHLQPMDDVAWGPKVVPS